MGLLGVALFMPGQSFFKGFKKCLAKFFSIQTIFFILGKRCDAFADLIKSALRCNEQVVESGNGPVAPNTTDFRIKSPFVLNANAFASRNARN
jgi:hypothetical protein